MTRLHGGALVSIVAGLLLSGGCRGASRPLADPGDAVARPRGEDSGDGVARPRGEDPPIVDTLPAAGWNSETPGWRPAGRDGRLILREGGSELGFIEQSCARQGNCGCELASEHHYSREGGRWKITVITPDVVIRTKVVRGTCGVGCGTQAPPVPRSVRSLGAVAPEDVEIVEQHPRTVVTVTTCTNPVPMP